MDLQNSKIFCYLYYCMYEKLRKIKIVDGILVVGILLIIIGLGMNFWEKQKGKDSKIELIKAKESGKELMVTTAVKREIMADIEGEVMNPGVYKLDNGSRINDILIMAGGLGAKADRDWVEKNLNKSEILNDGQKIYIPKIGEVLGKSQDTKNNFQTNSNDQFNKNQMININIADLEDLDKLSGVGPSVAQKIIDYREKNGGFKNIEEIKLVSGIGEKLFEKIKDQIEI